MIKLLLGHTPKNRNGKRFSYIVCALFILLGMCAFVLPVFADLAWVGGSPALIHEPNKYIAIAEFCLYSSIVVLTTATIIGLKRSLKTKKCYLCGHKIGER